MPSGGQVETVGRHHIDVLRMLVNDRVVTTPVDDDRRYERYWCYPQGGAAIFAALAWDGAEDTEPVGWIKSWDQRYGEEHRHLS